MSNFLLKSRHKGVLALESYMQIHHTDIDITITETECVYHMQRPHGFTFSKADQDYHTVALILGGNARYRVGKQSFKVQKGDVVFFREGTQYNAKVVSQEPWEHIVISFRTSGAIDAFPPDGVVKVTHSNRFEELFRQAYKAWSECGIGYKMQTKAVIHQILYSLVRENVSLMIGSSSALQALKAASDYVEQNYRQKITVEELAALSGYSTSHFTRVFTKVHNASPIQYVNQIRIMHAKNLLRTGQYTIAQIALECGFSNVYYFSRCFKQITGTTPAKW